ncbi:V-type ATP synthase subunit E [Candidatus Poribacteria bacterium]
MGGVVGNIEALKDRILKQAQEEAAEILDRASRVAERDLVYAREEAEEIASQQREKMRPLAEVEGRKTIVDAEMEARRELLEKKEELVSRVFTEAENRLEELRGSKIYMDIVTKLIEEGVASIGGGATVEFGEKDRDAFTSEAISSIESHMTKALGADLKLEFLCVGDLISSGVRVRSKDGRVIIDNSFSNLLKRLREELRGEIAEMLLQE